MQSIRLKPHFLDAVRSGRKRSTVRAGARLAPLGPATIVSGPVRIPIELTQLTIKPFKRLTEEDAREDGFTSLEELRGVLLEFYPRLGEEDPITIFSFLLEAEE